MVVALILASAALHAGWNAMLRLEPDKDRGVTLAIGLGALLAAAVAGVRAAAGEVPFPSAAPLAWTLVAGVVEAAYFAALARALTIGPLGIVYTISRGGTVPLVWGVSVAIWAEPVTAAAVVGSVAVIGGLAVAGGGRGASRAAVGWACGCAVLIAGYHLAYKAALDAGGSPAAVFAVSLGLAAAIGLARQGTSGRAAAWALWRARRWRLIATGALCSVAFLVFLEGLARGGAGLAITLRNTSVLFALGLAWWIGDPLTWRQGVGAALVTAGAVVLALG